MAFWTQHQRLVNASHQPPTIVLPSYSSARKLPVLTRCWPCCWHARGCPCCYGMRTKGTQILASDVSVALIKALAALKP